MKNNGRNLALLAVGVVLIAIGVGADALGFGPNPGFGWKQQLAAGVGAIAAVIGLVGIVRARG